ncbi:hypothetical protein ABU614_09780 [Lysobacter firmicutimachus]|uniref:Outer membrane lipoprotein carrier protein LolA n=1 Tax=Lysobacter firmicutimachus TaxID=1792846 RepID=A0AAU8N0Q8_9GAMM
MIKPALSATPARAAVLIALLASAPAAAGPKEELIAAVDRLNAARSYRSVMSADTGLTVETEFVAPDRMRVRMGQLGERVVVGTTMYETYAGNTRKTPMPGNWASAMHSRVKLLGSEQTLSVALLGEQTVAGQPIRVYRADNSQPRMSSTFWIGAHGYPLQVKTTLTTAKNKSYTSIVRYSRHNDPGLRIDPPAMPAPKR